MCNNKCDNQFDQFWLTSFEIHLNRCLEAKNKEPEKKNALPKLLLLLFFLSIIIFDVMGHFTFTTHATVSSDKPEHSFSLCSNPAARGEAAAARIRAFCVHLHKARVAD